MSQDQETEILKEQAEHFEDALKNVKARLNELESKSKEK